MKKLFRTLSAGFAILQKHSGDFCTTRDFCNFLNFVMIPFLQEDVQNVFEVLGRNHNSKNMTIIKIQDMKKTMKSKTCEEIIDVEIRIIIEVISKQISQSSIDSVIISLDHDKDGLISASDFTRVFMIRETQAFLFFSKVFHDSQVPISRFLSLFPDSKKFSLPFLESDLERAETNFFPLRSEVLETKKSPKFSMKESLVENLRERLKTSFDDFFEAFKIFANAKLEIGFFQMQKVLQKFGFPFDEKTVQKVLIGLSGGLVVRLKDFKEFWTGRREICCFETCCRAALSGEEACNVHIGIRKQKALMLLTKVKSQTAIWKSPRKRLKFFNDLETASSRNDLTYLKSQLNQFLPVSEIARKDLANLHSIIGKIN
jgi:Ca2+-binding EF-hand superfamily protein